MECMSLLVSLGEVEFVSMSQLLLMLQGYKVRRACKISPDPRVNISCDDCVCDVMHQLLRKGHPGKQ